ncbi:MAG: hypothetical protein V7L17_09685 [Nostoc sp.]
MQHMPLRVRHFLQVGEPAQWSASPISLVFAYGIDGQSINYNTGKISDSDSRAELTQLTYINVFVFADVFNQYAYAIVITQPRSPPY